MFTKNCTALIQSDSTNVFGYIINFHNKVPSTITITGISVPTEAWGGGHSDFVFIFHFSFFVLNVLIFTSQFCFSIEISVFIFYFSVSVFHVFSLRHYAFRLEFRFLFLLFRVFLTFLFLPIYFVLLFIFALTSLVPFVCFFHFFIFCFGF